MQRLLEDFELAQSDQDSWDIHDIFGRKKSQALIWKFLIVFIGLRNWRLLIVQVTELVQPHQNISFVWAIHYCLPRFLSTDFRPRASSSVKYWSEHEKLILTFKGDDFCIPGKNCVLMKSSEWLFLTRKLLWTLHYVLMSRDICVLRSTPSEHSPCQNSVDCAYLDRDLMSANICFSMVVINKFDQAILFLYPVCRLHRHSMQGSSSFCITFTKVLLRSLGRVWQQQNS